MICVGVGVGVCVGACGCGEVHQKKSIQWIPNGITQNSKSSVHQEHSKDI